MKGFRKRAAAVALGVCMAAGAAFGLCACDWVADDPAVSNPSDAGEGNLSESEDPVTEPEEPTAEPEEPEQGGSETEDPEQGGSETEDPEQGGETEPEDPEQGGTTEPEEPAPSGPSLDEIMAAYDVIYGYEVTADGRDFVRDESGNPITVFKHEKLYETIMNVFYNKPMIEGSSFSYYDNFYGDYSSTEDIFWNYNATEKIYTIASLCEYANPRTENDKTLKIIQIPMDLSSNSFSDLQNQLNNLVLYQIETINYDYKLSNIEHADDYLPSGIEYSDKEFADRIATAFYRDTEKPENILVLLEDLTTSSGGYDLGIHDIVDTIIVEFSEVNISIKAKTIRISERGNNFCYNLIHYYNDETYVVVSDILSEKTINLDKVFYNENLIEEILAA